MTRISWEFKPALSSFEGIRGEWDVLNHSQGNHLLLDSRFVGAALRHFGNSHVLLSIHRDSQDAGMALLIKKSFGIWETFQPAQAPLGLFLMEKSAKPTARLRDLLNHLPGHALQLSVLQQDPDYSFFPPSHEPLCETMEYIPTARLPITGTFEEYWKSRGSNLRHNLARRRRRMSEQGLVAELVAHRDPAQMPDCIREYGNLESRGWKGKDGTAIAEDNVQGRFYREVFESFSASREAVVYQWRINGKVAATDLCLCRDGMMIVLKTTYDEELEAFAPALMMREEIMKLVHAEQQVRVIEFYGKVMEWHKKWTDQVRTMYHVSCFRHRWVPSARNLLKRFR